MGKIIATCGHEIPDIGVAQECILNGETGTIGVYCKECTEWIWKPESLKYRWPDTPEQLAEAHCAYNVGLYRKAFLDGFTHGFNMARRLRMNSWHKVSYHVPSTKVRFAWYAVPRNWVARLVWRWFDIVVNVDMIDIEQDSTVMSETH